MMFGFCPNTFRRFFWNSIQHFHGFVGVTLRYCILKASAKSCGDNVFIGPFVQIKNWDKLNIGDNVSIHSQCYIEALGEVYIGSNVSIAQSCSIFSTNHTWADTAVPIKYNPLSMEKVTISDDVWIGSGCKILGGVSIATRSIIGAGSVVTKNTETNSLYGGVPAKRIKSLY